MSDFLLDENRDLLIKNGDFVVGNSNASHIETILISEQGDFKQHPLVGVGLANYLNAPLTRVQKTALERQIRLQLDADGFEEIDIKAVSLEDLQINAIKDE